MRKALVILSLLLFVTSCGDSKERQARELAEQANKYYQDYDLDSAIEVYEKSLELHEDEGVREKLRLIKQEREALNETRNLLKIIKDAKTSLYMPESDEQILDALREIQESLIKLPEIEAPAGTVISSFIKSLEGKNEYFNLKFRTDINVVNFQFLEGDADIKEYERLIDEFLKTTSFIDIYK